MASSLQQTTVNAASGLAQVSKQTFTLDGSDRISTIKSYTDSIQLGERRNYYFIDADSPAWTQERLGLMADLLGALLGRAMLVT